MKNMIQGSIVALVTPMTPDGALDFWGLDRLVDFHIGQGTDAIVAMGTTGESATLDPAGSCEVVRRVVERVAGRVPVIAGTGTNSTAGTIALTRRAREIGADACLAGAKGVISVTANVAPGLMRAMCAAAIAGDRHTAKAIDARLAALHRELFSESNPIPVKWALCEMGFIQAGIRLPLTWLSEEYRESLRRAMGRAGVVEPAGCGQALARAG